ITTGQLRIQIKELIKIISPNYIGNNDIRYLKNEEGTFPRKIVVSPTNMNDVKEVPYTPQDTFILFDLIVEPFIDPEIINNRYKALLPFRVPINIYGNNSDNVIQEMIIKLRSAEFRNQLRMRKLSLQYEPTDYTVLDGRENNNWWIRRRIELRFNIQQEYDLS